MSEFGIVEDTMFIPMVGRIYAKSFRVFYMIKKHFH